MHESGEDVRLTRKGRFLDLIGRIEYLRDLGVNAVQLLPIQEFPTDFSMGYNGTDLFSPEGEYEVHSRHELLPYVEQANQLFARSGSMPIAPDEIRFGDNQLRLFVDLCHLQGMAVLFDVVFNHAGGGFDPESLYFLDRARQTSNDQSLYFSNNGWAGGLVFDYGSAGVRQFLIDNAVAMLQEYRIDGLRYDEVSVADNFGGWWFCQDVTESVRFVKPEAIQIAEYWNDWRWLAVTRRPDGMGFDAAWSDRLTNPIRDVLRQASFGDGAEVRMAAIADGMRQPPNFPDHWRAVHSVENHDTVYARSDPSELKPRIALLGDPGDARSWWARSRARVATGLVLTAPGIPMLFMGQELLEDKNWSDNPRNAPGTLIAWDGLESDRAMGDHHVLSKRSVRRQWRCDNGDEPGTRWTRLVGEHRDTGQWDSGVREVSPSYRTKGSHHDMAGTSFVVNMTTALEAQ